ncbi:hypothetical protein, partial [Treponema sp. R6D11]
CTGSILTFCRLSRFSWRAYVRAEDEGTGDGAEADCRGAVLAGRGGSGVIGFPRAPFPGWAVKA